ncbi:DsrH/TusB family sulfur metabolism protein [Marinicellulosiphila megalodicopiae]|uniref:DsrH/TusB family sulfur metabolism protein n=1 Tax=Marinicellulosiphila megalodicopiae TaxID=2724896 RepID=UPI003BAE335A
MKHVISNNLPIESIKTLHTLKGISPQNCVTECIALLADQDALILIESGVNNLLIPEFIDAIKDKNIGCFVLDEDANARNVSHEHFKPIDFATWIDISANSNLILNWF